MHKLHQRSSHSARFKAHGVGTRKHFFTSNLRRPRYLHGFRPKKRGGIFFDKPLRPHLSRKLKKVGFKLVEEFWGVRTKTSVEDLFIEQNNCSYKWLN